MICQNQRSESLRLGNNISSHCLTLQYIDYISTRLIIIFVVSLLRIKYLHNYQKRRHDNALFGKLAGTLPT